MAIRDACKKLKHFSLDACELYTSCEPCPMCLAAIYWARCEAIFYGGTAEDAAGAGFDDARLYREISLPKAQRAIPAINLLREKAVASFDAWRSASRRIEY
jgi:tRNA(Arg) A34 adenosine deaminase TadA